MFLSRRRRVLGRHRSISTTVPSWNTGTAHQGQRTRPTTRKDSRSGIRSRFLPLVRSDHYREAVFPEVCFLPFLAAAHRLSWPCRIRSFVSALKTLFLPESVWTGRANAVVAVRPRFEPPLTSNALAFCRSAISTSNFAMIDSSRVHLSNRRWP